MQTLLVLSVWTGCVYLYLEIGFCTRGTTARHVVEYGTSPESGLDCAISAGTEDSFYLLVRKIPFTNYETPLKQLDRLSSIRTYDEFSKKMRSRRRWGIFELLFGLFFSSCHVG